MPISLWGIGQAYKLLENTRFGLVGSVREGMRREHPQAWVELENSLRRSGRSRVVEQAERGRSAPADMRGLGAVLAHKSADSAKNREPVEKNQLEGIRGSLVDVAPMIRHRQRRFW